MRKLENMRNRATIAAGLAGASLAMAACGVGEPVRRPDLDPEVYKVVGSSAGGISLMGCVTTQKGALRGYATFGNGFNQLGEASNARVIGPDYVGPWNKLTMSRITEISSGSLLGGLQTSEGITVDCGPELDPAALPSLVDIEGKSADWTRVTDGTIVELIGSQGGYQARTQLLPLPTGPCVADPGAPGC